MPTRQLHRPPPRPPSRPAAAAPAGRPALVVRTVPDADYPLVAEFSKALAAETDPAAVTRITPARTLRGLRLIAADPVGRVLGAYTSAGLQGTLLVGGREVSEWDGSFYLGITSFYVPRPHRGRGVGRALYAAAQEIAKGLGAAGFQLHVRDDNDKARELYEEFGFEPTAYRLMRARFA